MLRTNCPSVCSHRCEGFCPAIVCMCVCRLPSGFGAGEKRSHTKRPAQHPNSLIALNISIIVQFLGSASTGHRPASLFGRTSPEFSFKESQRKFMRLTLALHSPCHRNTHYLPSIFGPFWAQKRCESPKRNGRSTLLCTPGNCAEHSGRSMGVRLPECLDQGTHTDTEQSEQKLYSWPSAAHRWALLPFK